MRDNAAELGADAAMQQAVAGAGEQVWVQAATEQQELMGVTEDAAAARPRTAGHDPRRRHAPTTSGC